MRVDTLTLDLFGEAPPAITAVQPEQPARISTKRYNYHVIDKELFVINKKTGKTYRHMMTGLTDRSLKENVIARLYGSVYTQRPRNYVPRIFFDKFLSVDEMRQELEQIIAHRA